MFETWYEEFVEAMKWYEDAPVFSRESLLPYFNVNWGPQELIDELMYAEISSEEELINV